MKYTWRPANGLDVKPIVDMAIEHFLIETDGIFTPEPVIYQRNLTLAVINQFYGPLTQLVSIAVDENNNLLAYTWATRGEFAVWSDDEMVTVRIAHLDMSLSSRLRIELVKDMLTMWEDWARLCEVNIVCSSTMRRDQSAFLKLHERNGYILRGSFAYKKLNA
tara:strand:+ start:288 stop:776 length:489 start_codon:yes stop_codon:yes gene_type:complete